MKRSRVSRRSLLAGAAALGVVAPQILVRRSRAATEAFGRARHVLVLYARGGLRSHCLFNAVGTARYDPYGPMAAAGGTAWAPGAVLGRSDIETESFGTIDGLHRLTADVAVLSSVDIAPESARPIIDHDPAVERLGTAVEGSSQGLLSRLLEAHPRYARGIGLDNLPPVDIGNTTFGRTDTSHVPLRLPSATGRAVRRSIRRDWSTALRDGLDAEFDARTPEAYVERIRRLADAKSNAFAFSDLLVDPALDVVGAPEASAHGLTNAELLEVLGDDDLADLGDPESLRSWGPDVALAIRMFGAGAPMVAVERDMYDTHSNEDESLPVRAADLARQLAGVRFLLSRMEHPDGGTFWDATVVTVVSEFNRNNTDTHGYNSGRGSDHMLLDAHVTRNQAVPLLGGPIERAGAGGRLLGGTDAEMNPREPSLSMRSLQGTLLELLGAPSQDYWPDAPVSDLFA